MDNIKITSNWLQTVCINELQMLEMHKILRHDVSLYDVIFTYSGKIKDTIITFKNKSYVSF